MKHIITRYLAIIALLTAGTANAEVTANIGWDSEYIFRGVPQSDSSAFGGVDYANGGFYVGTWAADVGQGSEVDLYLGYVHEFEGGFSLGLGGTLYEYTDDFDARYTEEKYYGAYSYFSLEYTVGTYDNFGLGDQDYDFLALSFEYEGFSGTYGTFGDDFDGDYLQFGYSTTIADVDAHLDVIFSSDDLIGTDDTSIIFGISKSFTLSE